MGCRHCPQPLIRRPIAEPLPVDDSTARGVRVSRCSFSCSPCWSQLRDLRSMPMAMGSRIWKRWLCTGPTPTLPTAMATDSTMETRSRWVPIQPTRIRTATVSAMERSRSERAHRRARTTAPSSQIRVKPTTTNSRRVTSVSAGTWTRSGVWGHRIYCWRASTSWRRRFRSRSIPGAAT